MVNVVNTSYPNRSLLIKKLLRIMKLSTFLLFIACVQVNAKGFTQTVTLSVKDAPLEKVFSEIKKQTGYTFVYTEDLVQKANRVSLQLKNVTISDALEQCFTNQPFTYKVISTVVIINTKEEKPRTDILQTFFPPPPIEVRGRVVNENGEPVLATITVKGSSQATKTNEQGDFSLVLTDVNATLIITSVNIETIEIKVNGRTNLGSINVKTKVTEIQEVVINKGYYTTSRQLNTGNVSKVTATTIEKQPVSNPLQVLQGRVAGVQIVQATGVPGGSYRVTIRGRNNVRPGTDFPLYIIDGVPFSSTPLSTSRLGDYITQGGNPLSLINPMDIESMEVLKDGDATAIYGSRGANGVILITTKKGRSGSTKMDFNVYSGFGKVAKKMKLLSTEQYLEMRYEALANEGLTAPTATDYDLDGTWGDPNRYTDWQEVLTGGSAKLFNAQFALSGGSNKTQFYLGGGYSSEGTVYPADLGNKKGSAHFKLSHVSENGKFNAQVSASYMNDVNKLFIYDITNDALLLPPNAPELYTADGQLNWAGGTLYNPMGPLMEKYTTKANNLITSSKFTYKLLSNLQIGFSAGYTFTDLKEWGLSPLAALNPSFGATSGSASITDNDSRTWIFEPQGEYNIRIGKGKLTALAGATFQANSTQNLGLQGQGFVNDKQLENIQAASQISIFQNIDSRYKYNAIYGRLHYDYNQKYLVNITGRRDGTSRFGPGKQFVNFGSFGAAWIISKEGFMQNLQAISFAKIRGSYGTTGSDQVGDYGFLDLWNNTNFTYNGSPGLYPRQLFNRDYAWGRNRKLEVALEIGLFKDRVYVTTSFYRNVTPNQLINKGLPGTTGFPSIFENFPAVVENKGVELEVNTTNISNKSFQWTTDFNITFPKNTLLEFPNIESSSYFVQYQVGRSLSVLNRLHYLGVDPATGIHKFEDVDKDGIISTTFDRQFTKEISQKYYAGLENNITYKGFELNFLVNYVKQTGNNYMNSFYAAPGFMLNQPAIVMNRWRKPGDITDIQKFTRSTNSAYLAYGNPSDMKVGDASYLRLKSLRVAYQLSPDITQKLKLQQCKFYIQGSNLLTITNYLGLDPEVQDNYYLPTLRTITAGFQINL